MKEYLLRKLEDLRKNPAQEELTKLYPTISKVLKANSKDEKFKANVNILIFNIKMAMQSKKKA
jgi:hypothetical protein